MGAQPLEVARFMFFYVMKIRWAKLGMPECSLEMARRQKMLDRRLANRKYAR